MLGRSYRFACYSPLISLAFPCGERRTSARMPQWADSGWVRNESDSGQSSKALFGEKQK